MNLRPLRWVVLVLLLTASVASQQTLRQPRSKTSAAASGTNVRNFSASEEMEVISEESEEPHSRTKRLIWITDDGRLALPPGTVMTITPTISLPLVRHPLEGFLSNMTMSFPLTIDFDKLGLTDNENPLGVVPPLFARSMGRAAGSYLGEQKYKFSCAAFFKFFVFQLTTSATISSPAELVLLPTTSITSSPRKNYLTM